MDAQGVIVPLLRQFAECFSGPGFLHFEQFVLAHMGLLGMPHCVSEVMRLMGSYKQWHWTTPYSFMNDGRFSCQSLSQKLLELVARKLGLPEEVVVALDDTLVKKAGKHFFGLGYYPDPTDKNPGANKRKVLGHCWASEALRLLGSAGLASGNRRPVVWLSLGSIAVRTLGGLSSRLGVYDQGRVGGFSHKAV